MNCISIWIYSIYNRFMAIFCILCIHSNSVCGKSGHFYCALSVLLCTLVFTLSYWHSQNRPNSNWGWLPEKTIAKGLHVALNLLFHMSITEIVGFGKSVCQKARLTGVYFSINVYFTFSICLSVVWAGGIHFI